MTSKNFLSQLPPVLKLWWWIISLVVAFLPLGLHGLIIINAIFFALVIVVERKLKTFAIIFGWLLFFFWFNIVVNGFIFLPNSSALASQNENFLGHFIYSGGEQFGGVSWWSVNTRSLLRSLVIALRISMLFATSFLLTVSTSIYELAFGVERLCTPLRYLKIKTQPLSILFALVFKLLPIVKGELKRIKQAQAIRGFKYGKLAFLNPVKLKTLFIPVLLSTVKKTEAVAFALQAKGYQLDNPNKTHYLQKYNLWGGIVFLGLFVLLSCLLMVNNWHLVYWTNPHYSFTFTHQNFCFFKQISSPQLLAFWQLELLAIG